MIYDLETQRKIVWSAATDAANRHMKRHNRTTWDDDDYNAAITEYNRLTKEETN